jgi:diguanylate cyclase (GGDEF)-like protein
VAVGAVSEPIVHRESAERWKVVARRFASALRAAEGGQANAEALEARRSGLSVTDVHVRVITPAMYWIGELWMRGAITAADEHVATAICHRVLASLYASHRSHPADARSTVVIAAPAGEHHGLGPRMVADVLELAGFRVIYLGTDVPSDALAAAVAEYEATVVCISLTMSVGATKLEEAIEAVADARPDTSVLLGGQGVPRLLIDNGITYLANTEHVVTEVERLAHGDVGLGRPPDRAAARAATNVTRGPRVGIGTPESQMLDVTIDMGCLIREQARLSTQLRALAFRDHLTGLPNRRALDDQFTQIAAGDRPPGVVLLLLDLDRLKQINDQLGHDEGNRALCLVAEALSGQMRAGDLPSRLGGDEFAALLLAIDPDDARTLAERVQGSLSELSGSLELTISVGVALFDGDRRRTMGKADAALYRAKAGGRGELRMSRPQADPKDLTRETSGDIARATHALEEVRRLADTFLDDRSARLDKRAVTALESAAASRARLEALLSPRELEVLGIVSDGESNAEIAGRLVIAETTVETHVANIMRKLGARNRTQAAR